MRYFDRFLRLVSMKPITSLYFLNHNSSCVISFAPIGSTYLLVVHVLLPLLHDALVRNVAHVFEDMQPHHPADGHARASVLLTVERLELVLELLPVNLVGQKIERVLMVELVLQGEEHRLLVRTGRFLVHDFAGFLPQRYNLLVKHASLF